VFDDKGALVRALVEIHERAAAAAVAARGRFTVALTGGSAAALYGALAEAKLPWDKVHVFFGDERAVPADHADSNYRLAKESLLSHAAIPAENVHRVKGEIDPAEAARLYEQELLAVTGDGALDLVHLGMGPDGHVCSLFPGHALLGETIRLVASLTDSPKPPPARVTLTLVALERARQVLFLAMGASKAAALREATVDASSALPAARVDRFGRAMWLADRDAASLISP
jgi:6-phosphogluconolactonase